MLLQDPLTAATKAMAAGCNNGRRRWSLLPEECIHEDYKHSNIARLLSTATRWEGSVPKHSNIKKGLSGRTYRTRWLKPAGKRSPPVHRKSGEGNTLLVWLLRDSTLRGMERVTGGVLTAEGARIRWDSPELLEVNRWVRDSLSCGREEEKKREGLTGKRTARRRWELSDQHRSREGRAGRRKRRTAPRVFTGCVTVWGFAKKKERREVLS